jgi:S-adenosylmethionine hydrolase
MNLGKNIIALLTDFGTADYFVGAMKGAILSINPNAKIVDITHEIPPQDVRSAAFTLRACYKDFPEKTIFVAVVDPGVGSTRKAILVESENYYFIAPDNGLLSFVIDDSALANARASVIELTNKKYFAEKVSSTFHGRDIFAPVAAHLSNGVEPNEFGTRIEDFIRFETAAPRRISDEKIEAEIIHIDRFGNLITNLTPEDLPDKFSIEINGKTIDKLQNFYAQAAKDELFMIAGSAGFLEIAASQNSAAKILNIKAGQKIKITGNRF